MKKQVVPQEEHSRVNERQRARQAFIWYGANCANAVMHYSPDTERAHGHYARVRRAAPVHESDVSWRDGEAKWQ